MKKSRLVIIILLVLFIVSICIVFAILNSKNKQEQSKESKNEIASNENKENTTTQSQIEIDQKENEKYINVPPEFNYSVSFEEYLTVQNCLPKYLDMKIKGGLVSDNEKINTMKSLLNEGASEKTINVFDEKQKITIVDMVKLINGNVDTYGVYVITSNSNYESTNEYYFIVNLDKKNETFSLEELNSKYNNLNEIETTKIEEIKKNDYNRYEKQEVNDKTKSILIFDTLKKLILAKPQLVFFNYFDKEYREQRFETYNTFKDYVENNREYLKNITLKGYKISDDGKNITLRDNRGNDYIVNIESTTQFKYKIDDGIVLSDEQKEEYSKLKEKEKVKFNIKRWISMLNYKEYKLAYNFLDETFKEENYSTLEKFQTAMEEKYPNKYDKVSINLKEEGNVYIAEIQMSVDEEEFTDKYMTIFIKLGKDTDFTLSFDKQ